MHTVAFQRNVVQLGRLITLWVDIGGFLGVLLNLGSDAYSIVLGRVVSGPFKGSYRGGKLLPLGCSEVSFCIFRSTEKG